MKAMAEGELLLAEVRPATDGSQIASKSSALGHGLKVAPDPTAAVAAADFYLRGRSVDECRIAGFSTTECRDAGFPATDLLLHCFAPYGKPRVYNWSGFVGLPVIVEGKYGTLTYVHPDCPEDIRVQYDDGTTNKVNTHQGCLATDFGTDVARGSARLLRWDEEGAPPRVTNNDPSERRTDVSTGYSIGNESTNLAQTQASPTTETSHFETLKACGGVYQCWFIEKLNDNSQFIQHNLADGTYRCYALESSTQVDEGRWEMKDGSYTEHTGFSVSGTLLGDQGSYYMEVDCGPHGPHKYSGIREHYEYGFKGFATSLDQKAKRGDKVALAQIVVDALRDKYPGWGTVLPSEVNLKECSGHGGSFTYKVTAGQNAAPAALKVISSPIFLSKELFVLRSRAAAKALAAVGCSPTQLASNGFWSLEEWAASDDTDDLPENEDVLLGQLLARIHTASTEWFDPIRARLRELYPALENAPAWSHIWYFATRETQWLDPLPEPILRAFANFGSKPATLAGSRIVMNHGDFHMGNVVWHKELGYKVVDYEQSCVQAAVFDLAYSFKHWCHGPERREVFLRSYLEASGFASGDEHVNALWLDVERCMMTAGYDALSFRMANEARNQGLAEMPWPSRVALSISDRALEDAALAEEIVQKGFRECREVKELKAMCMDECNLGALVTVRDDGSPRDCVVNFDGTVQFRESMQTGLVLGMNKDGGVELVHHSSEHRLQLCMSGVPITGMQEPLSEPIPLLLAPDTAAGAGPGIRKLMVRGEVNSGLSWATAAKHAAEAGGRLPTVAEMKAARVQTGDFDQWQPVGDKGSDFWIQTGNAGRLYATEVPSEAWGLAPNQGWGNDTVPHHWRPTTVGSTKGSPTHHFYIWLDDALTKPRDALVLSDVTAQLGGVPVGLAELGAKESAVRVHFEADAQVRLADQPHKAFAVAHDRVSVGAPVVISHASGQDSQRFLRHADGSISPANRPDLAWGLRGDALALVQKYSQAKVPAGGQVPYSRLSVSASAEQAGPGEVAQCLLDDSDTTDVAPWFTSKWNALGKCPHWIEIEVQGGPIQLSRYDLKSANDCPDRDPLKWKLVGVDGVGEEHLLHSEEQGCFEGRWQWSSFVVTPAASFSKFRFHILENGGGDCCQLGQLRLFVGVMNWQTLDGSPLSWDQSEVHAGTLGGRLITLAEAQSFLEKQGPLFPDEDRWAAVATEDGGRDWVQLGDKYHSTGLSHVLSFGYPNWGDNETMIHGWGSIIVLSNAASASEAAPKNVEEPLISPDVLLFSLPGMSPSPTFGIDGSSITFTPDGKYEVSFQTLDKCSYEDAFVGNVGNLCQIQFSVCAAHDAHISLGESLSQDGKHWEIALGTEDNTKSCIRARSGGSELAVHDGKVLSNQNFRDFWITWSDEALRVGRGQVVDEEEILSYRTGPHGIMIKKMHVACAAANWRVRFVAAFSQLASGCIAVPAVPDVEDVTEACKHADVKLVLASHPRRGFALRKLDNFPDDSVKRMVVVHLDSCGSEEGADDDTLPLLLRNQQLHVGSGVVALGVPNVIRLNV